MTWLERTNISAVQTINVDLWLKDDTAGLKVGSGPANYFFDPDQLTFYLASQKPNVMYNVLGQAINSQLDDLKFSDTASLTSILSCQPVEIDEILTQLHVAAIPENTQREFDFEDVDGSIGQIGRFDEEESFDAEVNDPENLGKEAQEQFEDQTEAPEIKGEDFSAGIQLSTCVSELG